MPLARRLSNSSVGSSSRTAANGEKHAPSMRPSLKSTGSASRGGGGGSSTPAGGRPQTLRRQSSATKLVQEAETKAMLTSRHRRASLMSTGESKKRAKEDKENDSAHPPRHDQDLTPGRMTRSARKKQKMMAAASGGSEDVNCSDGMMIFSPPNQKENARREKEEYERKMKERNSRVEANRKKGLMLELSSNLDSLTSLPPDEQPLVETKKASPAKERVDVPQFHGDDEKDSEDESIIDGEKEGNDVDDDVDDVTSASASSEKGDIETRMVVEMLRKDVQELNRRVSGIHPPLPPQLPPSQSVSDPADKLKIEAQALEIQSLSSAKTTMEERNHQLSIDLKLIESKLSSELDRFVGEKNQLESQVEKLEMSYRTIKDQLQDSQQKTAEFENTLLPQSNARLQQALAEIDQYKKELDEKMSVIEKYEIEVDDLKSQNDAIFREKEEEELKLQSSIENRSKLESTLRDEIKAKIELISDLKATVASLRQTVENEKAQTIEFKKKFESTLEKLQAANKTKLALEEELLRAQNQIRKDAKFKEEVIVKHKASSATVKVMEEDRQNLNHRLKDLERELAETREARDHAILRLGTSDQREDELFMKLQESDRVRRELHARVMYLSGNIRVYVRVRPQIPGEGEQSEGDEHFNFSQNGGVTGGLNGQSDSQYGSDDPTKNLLQVIEPKKDRGGLSQRRKKWTFGFDEIYGPSSDQFNVWKGCEPLVQSAIDGFNATIFAYGQTGSGKTYTMLGDSTNSASEGIISRAIRKLFNSKTQIEELSRGSKKVSLSVELLEIYNENVRDLLSSEKKDGSLKIVANEAVGSTHLPVSSEEDVFTILEKAQQRRCVKATASNATSSRSHMLFTIVFNVKSKEGSYRTGKLHVCDLAGSERLGKSGANNVGGALLSETKHINLSLSTLSNVIEKLQSGDKNVPFRESKLTSLLQNSLGGNSKTLCIVCASPLQIHFHETLCSLRFAAKINKVEMKAQQNFSA